MKLVKVKNKYMFESEKVSPDAEHYYLHYYDRKSKETRLIQLTHIYEKPYEKTVKLRKNFLTEMKFKDLYLPSGVNNNYLNTDVNGNKLKYSSRIYTILGTAPQHQAKKVLAFAKTPYERKKGRKNTQ